MPWNDLIKAANKAKGGAKIQESTHLDQRYPRGTRPLKMSLNFSDNQTDKKALQSKNKANQAKQVSTTKKSSKKAKNEKKKKGRQGRRKKSNSATEANAAPATITGDEG